MDKLNSFMWEFGATKCLSANISSKFTKWLLNNDKIDLEKLNKELDENAYINNELAGTNLKLIMLLSTKEDPIWFLQSILK